jgi:UDP-GlcNAc:undecaprenyl-phosphate GlcNAc-1-phosphate transferase
MTESHLLLGVLGLVLALVLTPVVRWVAARAGVVDYPRGRRWHRGEVPKLGGVAILLAAVGALAIGESMDLGVVERMRAHQWHLGWLLAGVITVTVCGVLDDVREIGPFGKLVLQLIAGCMALAGGYGFYALTNPFSTDGHITLGLLGPIVTLVWVVGITNAVNLIDGLDGLAAGVALIAFATLFGVSLLEGRGDAALLSITLAGVLLGFLFYNFNPASIFLGDSGSLLLGFLLAVMSVQALQKGTTAVVVSVPLLALGLPIMDTAMAVLRRFLLAGAKAVLRGDREHIHHQLLRIGMTHRRAVLFLYAVCAAFSGLAFLAVLARGKIDAVIVGGVALITFFGIRLLGRAAKRRDGVPRSESVEESASLRSSRAAR